MEQLSTPSPSRNPRIAFVFHFLLAASCVFLNLNAHADTPASRLKALSNDEMNFLLKNCPEMTRMVSSGVVVAYGEIIEAPMLVTVNKDRIEINSIQVSPSQERGPDFQANKVADKIRSQLYLDEQQGIPNPSDLAEKHLQEHKSSGKIEDFRVLKRDMKLHDVEVTTAGGKATIHADYLPMPLWQRYTFIVNSILHVHALKKESEGKEKAQQWLGARLAELQVMGVIAKYEFVPIDTVNIELPKEPAPAGYYIGDYKSPHGVEYTKNWKSKRTETQAKADEIVAHLKANGILIHSFAFEKTTTHDLAVLNALALIQQGRDIESNRRLLLEKLSLTDEQANALVEELR